MIIYKLNPHLGWPGSTTTAASTYPRASRSWPSTRTRKSSSVSPSQQFVNVSEKETFINTLMIGYWANVGECQKCPEILIFNQYWIDATISVCQNIENIIS